MFITLSIPTTHYTWTNSKEQQLTVVEAVANLVPEELKSNAAKGVSCAVIPATAL